MTGIEIGIILGGAALIGGASGLYARRKQKQKQAGNIFGRPLSDFKPKKLTPAGIIKPLEAWFNILETTGANTQEIFKRHCSNEPILELYEKISAGKMNDSTFEGENTFVIAGVLQMFLRELPECIFCNYNDFIQAEKTNDEEQWFFRMQFAFDKLPTPNILHIKRMFDMLNTIAKNHETTKVTLEDLSEELGPCLFFSTDSNEAMKLYEDIKHIKSLIVKIIQNMDKFNFSRLPSKANLKKSGFFESKRRKIE